MNIKNIFILWAMIFASLSFLFFQEGIWLYVDSAGWPLNIERYKQYIWFWLNSFSNITYFWFDGSIIQSSRLLQTFTKILPMEIYYISFFFFSFLTWYYTLRINYSKKSSFYWALLFTFNPVSFYFLKQVWYIYAYFSLPLIILSVYQVLKTHKIIYLLLWALWVCFLTSYTRLTWIYGIFLIAIAWYYYKEIIHTFKYKKRITITIIAIVLLTNSPFLLSLIFPHISGDKAYFSGLSNYADSYDSYQKYFYNRMKWESFIQSFYVKEILHDFADSWQKSMVFIWASLILTFSNIFYFTLWEAKNTRRRRFVLFLSWVLFLTLFIKAGAEFMPEKTFSAIAYNYFPFIANNTNWLYLIYVPILGYMFTHNLEFASEETKKKFIAWSLIYIFISLMPLVGYIYNPKSQLVDISNMSNNYTETLFTKNWEPKPAIFLPHETLYIEWNPYHIKLHNNNNYELLFHGDIRSVNKKQQNLKKSTYKLENYDSGNFFLFNLKNIFVYKNIVNIQNWLFDWYNWEWLKEKAELQYGLLLENDKYYTIENNSDFTKFWLKGQSIFEYFIYAPAKITRKNGENFLKEPLNVKERIINIDDESYKAPDKIKTFKIPNWNRNIRIDYKRWSIDSTKYYLKISNVDTNKDFLVQMNQTFSNNWKLKWINEADFRKHSCIENYEYFNITNNSYCYYNSGYLDSAKNHKYFWNISVKTSNHFEWNFIWNTWLVEPSDIREQDKWSDTLYAVIVYEKQFWYIWCIIISISTLMILFILSILQQAYFFIKKIKWSS